LQVAALVKITAVAALPLYAGTTPVHMELLSL